jgi:hypothetical protein
VGAEHHRAGEAVVTERPSIATVHLAPIPIRYPEQVETLRRLRNATRQGFSTVNVEIGMADQQRWWAAMQGKVLGWLYEDELANVVGFGLLRQSEDGRWWTTVGVLPEYGGLGYGSAITHDVVRKAPGVCHATARLDNPAAQRLHRPEDWEEVGRDERLVHYRTRTRAPIEALEHWEEHGWALT